MCGIVGVLGKSDAAAIILDGLKRLEYRGYDSAGIATVSDGALTRRRAIGKLSALSELVDQEPIKGSLGIGHTRWATHGAPTVATSWRAMGSRSTQRPTQRLSPSFASLSWVAVFHHKMLLQQRSAVLKALSRFAFCLRVKTI